MTQYKDDGTIGELAVSQILLAMGWRVYKDITDFAPADLVVIKAKANIRIQVKSLTIKQRGVISIGPCNSRRRRYSTVDVDVIAVYIRDIDKVVFVTLHELHDFKAGMSIRYGLTKSGQKKNVRDAALYESFDRCVDLLGFNSNLGD